MDQLGVVGCEQQRDRLIKVLRDSGEKLNFWETIRTVTMAAKNGLLFKLSPEGLFDEAMSRARKEMQELKEKRTVKTAPKVWSYGVITTPLRRETLLPRTLRSLRLAGFDDPLLSVDNYTGEDYSQFGLRMTTHNKRVDNFANWYLTAVQVYLENPFADLYAVFEDDFVMSAGAREYLECSCKSEEEYYSLFTDPRNAARCSKTHQGWFVADQLGRGAVGLVFNRKPFMTLLSDVGMLIHPTNKDIDDPRRGVPRGKEYVDGMIVTIMKRHSIIEMCHRPSIVQHVGTTSSRPGAGSFPPSQCFNGEGYDLRALIDNEAVSDQ
jgi:hypothetical protein